MATIRDRYILDIDTTGAGRQLSDLRGKLGALGKVAGVAAIGTAIIGIGRIRRDFCG